MGTNTTGPTPTITDTAGNKYCLVRFFDHDSKRYLFALELFEEAQ